MPEYTGNPVNVRETVTLPGDNAPRNRTTENTTLEQIWDQIAYLKSEASKLGEFQSYDLPGNTPQLTIGAKLNVVRCLQIGSTSFYLVLAVAASVPDGALVFLANMRGGLLVVQDESNNTVVALPPGGGAFLRVNATGPRFTLIGASSTTLLDDVLKTRPLVSSVVDIAIHIQPSAWENLYQCYSLLNDTTWTISDGLTGMRVRVLNGSVYKLTVQRHGGGAILAELDNEQYVDLIKDDSGSWVGIGRGSMV